MTYTIKYNRSSYHIDGIATRTKGNGEDTGSGAVPYFAESVCGALTRGRFVEDSPSDDLAATLKLATMRADNNNMKMCKNCEKAANEVLAQL